MGVVIEFPNNDPGPFHPSPAVIQYIEQTKCDAKIHSRIPIDLLRYLKSEASASDKKLSAHIYRILLTWAMNPRLQDLLCTESKVAA